MVLNKGTNVDKPMTNNQRKLLIIKHLLACYESCPNAYS